MPYSAEQYEANKERIKAAQKRYYECTHAARLEYQKRYDGKGPNSYSQEKYENRT
ncbi:hypothetical protein DVH05_016625 [Phytophthora capsici]|nr:hypothetical protein DVH05_018973 [Phytophthora capsici]KAG1697343.1 hypothetical protein DVH05_016625 [Phytophthora capsici]|eukprot:jgi/Phyca11/106704/e_gw1.12.953.1